MPKTCPTTPIIPGAIYVAHAGWAVLLLLYAIFEFASASARMNFEADKWLAVVTTSGMLPKSHMQSTACIGADQTTVSAFGSGCDHEP